eukprot:4732348-Lingulodinium_polyedra.AAC.1
MFPLRSTKVLPEVQGMLPAKLDPELLEGLSEEEQAQLVQAKETMASCVRRFLGVESGAQVSMPKQYRRATYRWLQGLDHALWVMTGKG